MSSKEIEFFNQLAERWDALRSADESRIAKLVAMIGLNPGDKVLDVGSGTGVVIPFLKKAVGEDGKITAIDFAEKMLGRARQKYAALKGISYVAGDVMHYKAAEHFDKIVCFNFFPHAADKPAFLLHMREQLAYGGRLVIMHDISRAAVNAIHKSSETVKNDRLPASDIVVQMLTSAGYDVEAAIDNDEIYFIKAKKRIRRLSEQ